MKRRISIALACIVGCEAGDAVNVEPEPGEPPVDGPCDHVGADDRYATCVASFEPVAPASFGHDEMPDVVLGPPVPGAGASGSLDVASLGCGGSITLGFRAPVIDAPGADIVVFENAFAAGDTIFTEPARVLLSDDGESWYAVPCLARNGSLDGCAGATPSEPSAVDSDDAATWGGDAFDLADVELDEVSWIRVVDETQAFYADDMWCMGAGGGFDLDAVAKVAP